MTIAFIASKGTLKLFSKGNYVYEICRLVRGEFKTVKTMYNTDLYRAKAVLEAAQDRAPCEVALDIW